MVVPLESLVSVGACEDGIDEEEDRAVSNGWGNRFRSFSIILNWEFRAYN